MALPKVYGLVGYPVKHSLSPLMHNAAFKALNIPAEYKLFEVKPEELKDFLLEDIQVKDISGNSVRTKDISGFNITIPYKVKAKEILGNKFPHKISEYADLLVQNCFWFVELTNAINTVKREKGVLHYFNTDSWGFFQSLILDLNIDLINQNVLIIGFGGAGRAILAGLSLQSHFVGKIYITDINEAVDTSLQELLPVSLYFKGQVEFIPAKQIPDKIKDCQLLINATPIGMKESDGTVIDKDLLHKDLFVYDVVYNRETQLIKDARSLGLSAVDGLNMLLLQAVRSFEIWTKKSAPVEIMREELKEGVKNL